MRHPTFDTEECATILRRHGVAMVVTDTAGKWLMIVRSTADFEYVRLHSAEELYVSGYSPELLDGWAVRVRAWQAGAGAGGGRDVYVYFDNDAKVHAPYDAMELRRLIDSP